MYKVISENKNNCDTQEELAVLKDLSLDYIIKNFSQKMIDIIKEKNTRFEMTKHEFNPKNNSN